MQVSQLHGVSSQLTCHAVMFSLADVCVISRASICPRHEDVMSARAAAQRAANADFEVLQPGSTVATALTEGEAKRKHAFLLEMLDDKFRTVKLPLETVRPFVYEAVRPGCVESQSRRHLSCVPTSAARVCPCR